jgi:Zn finger protein HypA/HybF involved in hydrogenase expression
MESEMSGKILTILLDEQIKSLSDEINERQKQLEMISVIKESIGNNAIVPANSILDVEHIMEKKNKTKGKRKLTLVYVGVGILCATQIALLAWLGYLAVSGTWWPIAAYLSMSVLGIIIALFQLKNKEYICPKCDSVFKLPLWRAFFTTGNTKVRWTNCPDCGHEDWCIIREQQPNSADAA